MTGARFVHLNVRSTYSLLEGLIPIKGALGKKAKAMGMVAVGVTDTNNLFGAVEMGKYLPDQGVQPILGLTLGLSRAETNSHGQPVEPDFVSLLVQNDVGWKNAMALSSKAFVDTPVGQTPQVSLETLLAHADGLILLTGNARDGRLGRLLREGKLPEAKAFLTTLAAAFSTRVYVEIQRHGMTEEKLTEADLVDLAYDLNLPLVATNECRFLEKQNHQAFDVLLCIGQGVTVAETNRRGFTPDHYFKSADEMAALFADLPEAVANTAVIAQRCAFKAPTGTNYLPHWPRTENDPPVEEILRQQVREGLERYFEKFVLTPDLTDDQKAALRKTYEDRLVFELKIIEQMGFAGYFLIVSDFCRWAQGQGIPVGPGRGSGAGSLVAWCLNITGLDPIKYGLFFERFLNPERVSLPDFDIDFCQERREEVIAYVRKKYGDALVAQIITFGSLKAKACIRDVGRVLQMPFGQVGRIAAYIPMATPANPDVSIKKILAEDERLKALYDSDDEVKHLLDIAMQLEGAYRHCSTHAAGVIIAGRPILEVCPLYKDPRSDLLATQFSMGDAEAVGLVKFDFLGLKTLTVIKYALDLIKKTTGTDLDLDRIALDDKKTFDLLAAGNTVGVFQVESQGMRELLKKLRPDRFEDVTALVALYRPGPLGSGMVDDFVACRHGRQEAAYPHPALESALKETYGVMLYQEQVMKCAQVLAGYTLGGADLMRRAMGKKKPEEMAKQREIFVNGAANTHKVPAEQANAIFDLIDKFSGYGFNKSHSLAYGYISYQTAYLKANHPLEFMAASMTLDRGNTDKLLRFKQDLDRMEVKVLPPDVNASGVYFDVEQGAIRYALAALKGAGEEAMRALVAERDTNGPYKDIYDFLGRHNPQTLNKRQLEVLIKAGALDGLERNRAKLLAGVDTMLGYMQTAFEDKSSNQISLFGGGSTTELPKPALSNIPPADALAVLEHEQQAVGFYLSSHPLAAYASDVARAGQLDPIASLLGMLEDGRVTARIAGIVLAKRELKTKSGKRMGFLTVSDTTGQHEVAIFPETYANMHDLLEQNVPLIFEVKLEANGEDMRLAAESVVSLESAAAPPKALRLKLASPQLAEPIASTLAGATGGKTVCELEMPVPSLGRVVIRLPQRVHARRATLLKLEAIPGLDVVVRN
jgi:DNA polymerase-3 subunit alpha